MPSLPPRDMSGDSGCSGKCGCRGFSVVFPEELGARPRYGHQRSCIWTRMKIIDSRLCSSQSFNSISQLYHVLSSIETIYTWCKKSLLCLSLRVYVENRSDGIKWAPRSPPNSSTGVQVFLQQHPAESFFCGSDGRISDVRPEGLTLLLSAVEERDLLATIL